MMLRKVTIFYSMIGIMALVGCSGDKKIVDGTDAGQDTETSGDADVDTDTTPAITGVVFKEDFSGYYSSGVDKEFDDPDNDALNNRDIRFWHFGGVSLVELSTIATYDSTDGLQSVPLTTNPAISASDIPSGRGGNIVNGALLFPYDAGINSWKETRFHIEHAALEGRPGLKEVWVQYDQFIATNFKDRVVDGHWGSKVFVLYAENYGAGNPVFVIGRGGSVVGDSFIRGEFQHEEVSGEGRIFTGFGDSDNPSIDISVDNGKWQRRTIHVKLPTTQSSNDGVMEVWIRHGDNVICKHVEVFNGDFLDVDEPFLRHGYILGWSNNGFDEPTSFLFTNFILSESVEHIDSTAIS